MKKKLSYALFFSGLILLLINIYGLFIPLRNEEINKKIQIKDVDILQKEIDKIFSSSYSLPQKVTRLNDLIHANMVYKDDEQYTRVPVYENYILYIMGEIYPSRFSSYEFSDYKKTLERGAAWCSGYSIIVSEILREKNINSKILRLKGHVVTDAQINENEWWVLDPTYGVVIKHNIEKIESDPNIVASFYKEKGYNESTEGWVNIVNDYDKDGNMIYEEGVKDYHGIYYYFEKAAYIMKWAIPVILMLPLIILYFKNNKRETAAS